MLAEQKETANSDPHMFKCWFPYVKCVLSDIKYDISKNLINLILSVLLLSTASNLANFDLVEWYHSCSWTFTSNLIIDDELTDLTQTND